MSDSDKKYNEKNKARKRNREFWGWFQLKWDD